MRRLLPRVVAPLTVAAALVATPVGEASAQLPCAATTLDVYLADPAYVCRVGDWAFGNFQFTALSDATGSGTFAVAAPATDVLLSPFTGVDASGRNTFGFAFDGLTSNVYVINGDSGDEFGIAINLLSFTGINLLAPAHGLARVELDLSTFAESTTPGRLDMFSEPGGSVMDLATGFDCFSDGILESGPGSKVRSPNASCAPPRPQLIQVDVGTFSLLGRDGTGTRTVNGSTSGSVDRITFTAAGAQVVPEPTTVVLVGGGLLALAGAAARRRSRS